MEEYLRETPMLDFSAANIQRLISDRKWNDADPYHRIKQIYNFVRDEILFGYNVDDGIPASKVLADGYGQCNTKGTLFMALLRGVNVPCRVHGFCRFVKHLVQREIQRKQQVFLSERARQEGA